MATQLTAAGCFKKTQKSLKDGDVLSAFRFAARGDGDGGHLKVHGYYRNKKGAVKGPRTFSPFAVEGRVEPTTGELYYVAHGWDSFAADVSEMLLDSWVEGAWNFLPEYSQRAGEEVLVSTTADRKGRFAFINPNKCGIERKNALTGDSLVGPDGEVIFTKTYEALRSDSSRWVPVSELKDVFLNEDAPTIVMAKQLYS